MGYTFKDRDIKERRVRIALFTLRSFLERLYQIQEDSVNLFDKEEYMNEINILSGGVLPTGNELVFNHNGLYIPWDSESKIIDMRYEDGSIVTYLLNILEKNNIHSTMDETVEYDYLSYEVLNEIYRATFVIYKEYLKVFGYYTETEMEEFLANNNYDDSGRPFQLIFEYNTEDIDDELDDLFIRMELPGDDFYIADEINRNEIINIYEDARNKIKFYFTFDIVDVIFELKNEILFVINGLKKYDVRLNTETQDDEEIFFPMHNKHVLDGMTMGGAFRY